MRVLWLVVLVACSKEPRKPPPNERATPQLLIAPPVALAPLRVRYAARAENAADGSSSTFFNIVEDEGLFVVADAGAATGAGDPAKTAAQGVSPFPGEDCRKAGGTADVQLACVVRRVNDRLVAASAGTTSLAAVVIDREAFVVLSGTAWVVRIKARTRELEVLSAREPVKPLGTSSATALSLHTLDLAPGDTVAIVNRGVMDVLGPAGIARALPATFADATALEVGVEILVGAGIRGADHPAIAVILLYALP